MTTTRFDAEEIIRGAASGAFPGVDDVLLRIADGWVFSKLDFEQIEGEVPGTAITSLPFEKLTGIAARSQLPIEIAYEDEVNVFLLLNTFQTQVRRGIRTITLADSPYTWQASDWHLNVNTDSGEVRVLVPDAADHFLTGFTDQLHVKKIGTKIHPLVLVPAISGQEIDGFSEAIIRRINRSFTLVSDGSKWWIQ